MKNALLRALWSGAALLALLPGAASAAGYSIGEAAPPKLVPGAASSGASGPIRLARFSFVQGDVVWRGNSSVAWSSASVNLPIRQGAQIWARDGGQAEVQFDDGSLLRLGSGATVILQTLHSDAAGEVTELDLPTGLALLELRGTPSLYQINTPFVSVKSEGPSKVRVSADASVGIAVRLGKATVESSGTKTTLASGDYLNVPDSSSAFRVRLLPDKDRWDRFSDDRDRQLADAESAHRLPPDIAPVAGNLDAYGSWHDDPKYGSVWSPRETDAGWRPYQHGRWTWVEPFGWTWVSDEPWGWAPYHYGTWVHAAYGWGWVPGPAQQYWCPAVVAFSEEDGDVTWAPLAPSEVHYPVYLAHCYDGGDWSAFFSLGGAAVYYPDDGGSCAPCPFNNAAVNGGAAAVVPSIPTLVRHPGTGTIVNRYYHPYPGIHPQPAEFVPTNVRRVSGATVASAAGFGGGGRYHPQAADGGASWTRGRSVRAPVGGVAPVSGPPSVPPAALPASSPLQSLLDDPFGAVALPFPVYRASLPARVIRSSPLPPSPARTVSAPPNGVPPAVSDDVRRNRPVLRQNAPDRQRPDQPVTHPQADSGPMIIVLPRRNNPPDPPREGRRRDEARTDIRTDIKIDMPPAESQPERREERPAPRPEEHPQEQRPQEQRPQEQRPPPASDKPDTKDSKADDKPDGRDPRRK